MSSSLAGVHGGGDDASPAGRGRSRHKEPLPEGQEEERPVAGVGPPRPPGQLTPAATSTSLWCILGTDLQQEHDRS